MASSGKRGCPYCVSEEYQDLGEYAGYAPLQKFTSRLTRLLLTVKRNMRREPFNEFIGLGKRYSHINVFYSYSIRGTSY
jgi:hypothetical protein